MCCTVVLIRVGDDSDQRAGSSDHSYRLPGSDHTDSSHSFQSQYSQTNTNTNTNTNVDSNTDTYTNTKWISPKGYSWKLGRLAFKIFTCVVFSPQQNTNLESSDVNLFLENSCRRFSETGKVALLERLRYSDSLLGPTIIYVPNASSLYSTPAHTHVKCAARNKHWRVVSCQTPVAVVCPEGGADWGRGICFNHK